MKNLLKFRLKRSRRQEKPAPVHIPPSPLAQSLIQGYLKGLRDQLEAEGRDHEIPLASGTRDQLEADCSRFYLQCAGFLLTSSDQAYRAGYDFFLARNGAEEAFPQEIWSGKTSHTLIKIAEKFDESHPIEGDDGLLYVA